MPGYSLEPLRDHVDSDVAVFDAVPAYLASVSARKECQVTLGLETRPGRRARLVSWVWWRMDVALTGSKPRGASLALCIEFLWV